MRQRLKCYKVLKEVLIEEDKNMRIEVNYILFKNHV